MKRSLNEHVAAVKRAKSTRTGVPIGTLSENPLPPTPATSVSSQVPSGMPVEDAPKVLSTGVPIPAPSSSAQTTSAAASMTMFSPMPFYPFPVAGHPHPQAQQQQSVYNPYGAYGYSYPNTAYQAQMNSTTPYGNYPQMPYGLNFAQQTQPGYPMMVPPNPSHPGSNAAAASNNVAPQQQSQAQFSHGAVDYNMQAQYAQQPAAAIQGVQMQQAVSRSIYVGNIPDGTSMGDLLNQVRGGLVEQVHMVPEKHCCFIKFVDLSGSLFFFQESITRGLQVQGKAVRVGWGKPIPPMNPEDAQAVMQGATRVVYVANATPDVTAERLAHDLSPYGTVEQSRVIPQKRIAFAHMTSVQDAVKAVTSFQFHDYWKQFRVNYGKDRCDRPTSLGRKSTNNPYETAASAPAVLPPQQITPSQSHSMGGSSTISIHGELDSKSHSMSHAQPPLPRVVYLGGLAEGTTCEDICNFVRAGGNLYSVRILPEKNCAFLTFVDTQPAETLLNHGTLVIRNKRVRVGKASDMYLPPKAVEQIQRGATRNLYFGHVDFSKFSVDQFREELSTFGPVEQVYAMPDKQTVFVNFCNLMDAVKALDALRTDPQWKVKFTGMKISFGRDRVAREFRPMFKQDHGEHEGKHRSELSQDETSLGTELPILDVSHAEPVVVAQPSNTSQSDVAIYFDPDEIRQENMGNGTDYNENEVNESEGSGKKEQELHESQESEEQQTESLEDACGEKIETLEKDGIVDLQENGKSPSVKETNDSYETDVRSLQEDDGSNCPVPTEDEERSN